MRQRDGHFPCRYPGAEPGPGPGSSPRHGHARDRSPKRPVSPELGACSAGGLARGFSRTAGPVVIFPSSGTGRLGKPRSSIRFRRATRSLMVEDRPLCDPVGARWRAAFGGIEVDFVAGDWRRRGARPPGPRSRARLARRMPRARDQGRRVMVVHNDERSGPAPTKPYRR